MPHRVLVAVVLGGLLAGLPGPGAPSPVLLQPAAVRAPAVGSGPAWALPLSGPPAVTRPFEAPAGRYGPGHRGVDLAGTPGQPVLAAGAGTVVFAGAVAGRPVVSVAHADGLRTTYEPVEPAVSAGQIVARGSPLGVLLAGHAGCPAAACLHWGARRGSGTAEVYLDPMLLLRPPRIRLLPFAGPAVGPPG